MFLYPTYIYIYLIDMPTSMPPGPHQPPTHSHHPHSSPYGPPIPDRHGYPPHGPPPTHPYNQPPNTYGPPSTHSPYGAVPPSSSPPNMIPANMIPGNIKTKQYTPHTSTYPCKNGKIYGIFSGFK